MLTLASSRFNPSLVATCTIPVSMQKLSALTLYSYKCFNIHKRIKMCVPIKSSKQKMQQTVGRFESPQHQAPYGRPGYCASFASLILMAENVIFERHFRGHYISVNVGEYEAPFYLHREGDYFLGSFRKGSRALQAF